MNLYYAYIVGSIQLRLILNKNSFSNSPCISSWVVGNSDNFLWSSKAIFRDQNSEWWPLKSGGNWKKLIRKIFLKKKKTSLGGNKHKMEEKVLTKP